MLTLDHISSRCQIMQMLVALSKFLIPHLEHILEETSNVTLAVEVDCNSIVLLRVSTRNSFMKKAFSDIAAATCIPKQRVLSRCSCFVNGCQQRRHIIHNSRNFQLHAKLFLYSFACLTSVKND